MFFYSMTEYYFATGKPEQLYLLYSLYLKDTTHANQPSNCTLYEHIAQEYPFLHTVYLGTFYIGNTMQNVHLT